MTDEGGAGGVAGRNGEDEGRPRALIDRFWEGLLELDPLLGTVIGDERYDDRLPDVSEAGLGERERFHRGALDDLGAIDREGLSEDERTSLDLLEAIARRELDAIHHRLDRFDAVTHFWGPGQMLSHLASIQRADTSERLDRYLRRLAAIPAYLDDIRRVAEGAVSAGQVSPALVVERTIGQVERLLALPPDDSPTLRPVPPDDTDGRDRVADVLRRDVMPAFERYLAGLRAYRPHARDTIGLLALPQGQEIYASQVRAYTTLPLDPREVHDYGRSELDAIQEERREIASRLGHADAAAAIAAHTQSGANTAASRADLVRLAEEQVRRSWEVAPRFFGRLPRANCRVREIEEYREQDSPPAYYLPPTRDGSRPGMYWINTHKVEERPVHRLASVTYHEANPGHHFQISIEYEFADRPGLRRFGGILAGSAFAEGWGLYCERLADEMGLYAGEYERLGMLEAQAWRAVRLVVDTGMHALGWPRDRAVGLMNEAGFLGEDAEIEVDRYIAWPGQALAYKIGQREIERLRREAAERGGAGFSLSRFHDRLLELGSLPLTALRREMTAA